MANTQGARRHFLLERLPESNVLAVDPAVCVGCRTCELMCSLFHTGHFDRAAARLYVERRPFTAEFTPEVCRQCLAPACYVVCPVEGAMTIDAATGTRRIVRERCVGCGACADACPWNGDGHIIRRNAGASIYEKCDLCGGAPQCVAYCPVHALTYVAKEGR